MDKVASLKHELAKRGGNYIALSTVPALKVHIQFLGKLYEEEVLWDANVQTLASYLTENPPAKSAKKPPQVRSFMQVEAAHEGVSQLTVILAVPLIDEPTLQKTIIMIRCYKRLKVGYHEFGKNL